MALPKMLNLARFHYRKAIQSIQMDTAMLNRRIFLQRALLASQCSMMSLTRAATTTKLVLLGTQGGPNLNLTRGESASVLVVNDSPYLIDCGYGTLRALVQSGVNYLNIRQVFLTHLHDDHNADLPALLGHQWTLGSIEPTKIFGPYGTDRLVQAANLYNQANAEIRTVDEARSIHPADLFTGTVVDAGDEPVAVFANDDVKITAIENAHFPDESKAKILHRSLSYRFDTSDRSIVFSGDTAYSDNLVKLARDADVLVCEAIEKDVYRSIYEQRVANGAYADNPEGVWNHIIGTHVSTVEAGRLAAAAGVKTLVLNHIIPGDIDDSVFIGSARKAFNGEIIVGKDQMVL
jgi:ribonuclease BN (tRNA processing enzyme)